MRAFVSFNALMFPESPGGSVGLGTLQEAACCMRASTCTSARSLACSRRTASPGSDALPALVQLRTTMLAEHYALLGTQAKQLAAAIDPLFIPTPDVQRLL
jgi:hypothetical protein